MGRKLVLGCGSTKRAGNEWLNLDIDPSCQPDIVRDLARGLPFDDGSVEWVYSRNCFEHLKPMDAVFAIQEVRRVLRSGGKFELIIPLNIAPDLSHQCFFHAHTLENLIGQGRYGLGDLVIKEKNIHQYGEPWSYQELRITMERR